MTGMPFTFATQPAGNIPASDLDANFANAVSRDQTNQSLTAGFTTPSLALGTFTGGTVTISFGNGEQQWLTNNGAFTLAAPSADGSCTLLTVNGASAGTITFSGFSVGSLTGDLLTTTNTNKFSIFIWRNNGTSGYRIAAHQ